jgi:RNA polymerase sigma-70 factor (ECF subfamily)
VTQATSDEALIARIASGDRLAMQVLFARHHARIYRFVLRLLRDRWKAEDLISEVFLYVCVKPIVSKADPRFRLGCW